LQAKAIAQGENPVIHKISLGSYHSAGDYGTDPETKILYLPVSYEIARFPWIASVTVPYMELEGPGDVFLEAGDIGRDRTGPSSLIHEDGLGDISLKAAYQFQPILNNFAFVDLSLLWKIPTADEQKDLGTGENDIGVQLDFYNTVGQTTWFSTFGYRFRGKTPLYDLRDSGYFSLGGMRRVNEEVNFGLIYDYRQPAALNSYETHELMPFISWASGERMSFMIYTIFGATEASADRTLGLQLTYTLP
jgi:hypothetical protein